jgi:hypothetical protein
MHQRSGFVRSSLMGLVATMSLGAVAFGCLDRPTAAPKSNLQSGVRIPVVNNAIESVDILFEIDNSNSMSENQNNLARNFGTLIDSLVNPPRNPMTMRPVYPPVKSLHVGVISSDLGTPGSVVPSCANSDTGDDGLLNPIRNGLAIRTHQPWMTAPMGRRPTRCTTDPTQFPSFLTFDAATTNPAEFRDDFICNAYLSIGGCGLEQQLESAYRALVIRNPRAIPGNTDPNAGFVRENAVLAIVMVTDEEDGSVRDCRFAEAGVPCTDAVSVFDIMSPDWASSDLNMRFYMYTPGSRQDPTWPIDRYIDPMRPNRGFTSLKPGRPDLVIFSSIAGVPINVPMRMGSTTEVDWDTMLGTMPDGSNGYTGMSAEGPISMRQRNMDPMCSTRVVPACRREGSPPSTMCDSMSQYFAWPSRRVAQVARRFAERYNNGTISSICKLDYSSALQTIVERIQQRLTGRCLPRPLETTPPICGGTVTTNCAMAGTPIHVNCIVRETLPAGMAASRLCTTARGRSAGERDAMLGRDTCIINQVDVPLGGAPSGTTEGFFYDTRPDPTSPDCRQHIEFTPNAGLVPGASAVIECVQANVNSTPAPASM